MILGWLLKSPGPCSSKVFDLSQLMETSPDTPWVPIPNKFPDDSDVGADAVLGTTLPVAWSKLIPVALSSMHNKSTYPVGAFGGPVTMNNFALYLQSSKTNISSLDPHKRPRR